MSLFNGKMQNKTHIVVCTKKKMSAYIDMSTHRAFWHLPKETEKQLSIHIMSLINVYASVTVLESSTK